MIDINNLDLTDEQVSAVYAKVLGDKDTCVYMLRNIIFKIQSILEQVENDKLTPAEAMAALMTAYTPTNQ